MAYRSATRTAYNNRRFDELELNASQARAAKARFGDGSWKIWHFYDALACVSTEPESMWQLHDTIHRDWITAKPTSITARVAQAGFLTEYAWHARGSGAAQTVSAASWKLFNERLESSRQALINCRNAGKSVPEWWLTGMRIALGQGWRRDDYDRFCTQARALEPTFYYFDTARSRYLSAKWYGKAGEWEADADRAAAEPRGLGLEAYSHCLLEQVNNYNNVFRQTRASWPKTKQGFELMEQRYPKSRMVVSLHARMACTGNDQATAHQLFARLPENAYTPDVWVSRAKWDLARSWAGAPTGGWASFFGLQD
jgi:hypothetical protein